MAFTDIGTTGGRIYDANEIDRLNDLANQFNDMAEKADNEDTKKKNVIRYFIVGVSAVVILTILKLAVRNKK